VVPRCYYVICYIINKAVIISRKESNVNIYELFIIIIIIIIIIIVI
jgi:hypothetical protein